MKKILSRAAMILVVLSAVIGRPASAGTPPAPAPASDPKDKTFEGTATVVNEKSGTLTVKRFLFTKTFNIANDCKVSLHDNTATSLGDLHAGEMVNVHYESANGVLIAHQIVQRDLVFSGYIETRDLQLKTLVVRSGLISRHFVLPKECSVTGPNGKTRSLNGLKIGQSISVTYEEVNGDRIARNIDQPGAVFSGTIQTIDVGARTVKAKNLLVTRRFNLADGCKIVVDGRIDTSLNRLRLGDEVVLDYDDVNGVLVANRIGLETGASNQGSAWSATNKDLTASQVAP